MSNIYFQSMLSYILGKKRIEQLKWNTQYFRRILKDKGFIIYGNDDSFKNRKIVEKGKIDTYNTYTWPLTLPTWYRHFNI
jgi:hypothetical protein